MTAYSPWCMHGSEVRPPPNTAARSAPYSQELFGKSELVLFKTISSLVVGGSLQGAVCLACSLHPALPGRTPWPVCFRVVFTSVLY